MRKIFKEYTIYKYDELSEESQNRVVNEYIEVLLDLTDIETLDKHTNLYKAIKKAEDLQTPWFTMQFVWDYCKNAILKDIKKYEYYANGRVFEC